MGNKSIGFLNIYALNDESYKAEFWNTIASRFPQADSWVMGGNINMVKQKCDNSSEIPRKIIEDIKYAYETLLLRLEVEEM